MATGLQDAKPERIRFQSLAEVSGSQGSGGPSFVVRIERRSRRLLDPDNFTGGCKPLIDQLRAADIIPEDDPETIQVHFIQTKVSSAKEEGTQVTVRKHDT